MILRILCLFCLSTITVAAYASKPSVPAPAKMSAPVTQSCYSLTRRLTSGVIALRDCDDAPEIITLRGGQYRMGDLIGDGQPYERPAHEVKLGPFAIGRFEVTNSEWKACVKDGGCSEALVPADDQHGHYPVEGVSWVQAKAYVDWLAVRTGKPYRLPSEAEWEYAARAGSEDRYSWGSFDPDACSHVNLLDASGRREHPEWYWAEKCDDHYPGAAPVGSFPSNAWGFYDMQGNVWEWVADCWHSDYTSAPSDGSVWLSDTCRKHVNRGGGWGNNLRALRLSSRDADPGDAHSSGLGFRVARTMTSADLPQGPNSTPDKRRPAGVTLALAPKASPGKATKPLKSSPVPLVPDFPPPATSLAIERQLDVHITVNGNQSWTNKLQHSQGETKQDYVLSTRLRSDGVLYGDNLLDPDQTTRLVIKQQYLARQGLIRLKALNGGKLPHTAEEISALTAKAQNSTSDCMRDDQCEEEATERSAALSALQNNSIEDLEALIATPATGDAARWLYFFGYAGCPNSIHITSETHIVGEHAFDRKRKHLKPWSLDRTATSDGNDSDRATLCRRYTATVDIHTGDIYLENLYIPSPAGTTVRTIKGKVERIEEDLPVAAEMMPWATAHLSRTVETLNVADTLTANAPFDGDYTVLGQFDGKLDVTLAWSFKPVDGAPLAVIPPATAVK